MAGFPEFPGGGSPFGAQCEGREGAQLEESRAGLNFCLFHDRFPSPTVDLHLWGFQDSPELGAPKDRFPD